MHLTERGGHARELAAEAAANDADLVIVWGGDGTVNEAGSALVGSADARSRWFRPGPATVSRPRCVCRATHAPRSNISSPRRSVPSTSVFSADRPFFNIAGIGLDAHIATQFNRRSRGRRGKWPYVTIGVREG